MSIAGLDLGTSGCKCTIFEEDGRVSAYSYKDYPLILSKNNYIELNPDVVWTSVLHVIKKAVCEHNGSKIKAVCITSFAEAGALIDKNGRILYNSILNADFRGQEQCDRLIDKLGSWEITRRSGNNPKALYVTPKLMWLKENEPEMFKNAYKFMQYSAYVLYKLSGEIKEDWSLAARTMAFNVVEKRWDDIIIEASGLEKSLFPESVPGGKQAGVIMPKMVNETGLPSGTILVLGGIDQVAAAVGAGALNTSCTINSMGTVDCITPIYDKPKINKAMQHYNYGCVPYVIADHYVTLAFSFAGGALIKWYNDNFGVGSYEKMENLAPKEPTGILVLPHIMGAAAPYMDPETTGAIIGINIDDDKYSMYKAMLEGVAYETKINIDCLKKAGTKINKLTACGGGSRSKMWLQIKADILNIPIDLLDFEEAGTLGAAIMAGTACGAYKNLEDGVEQLVKVKETIYPNEKSHQRYRELYRRYKRVYYAVRDIYGRPKLTDE